MQNSHEPQHTHPFNWLNCERRLDWGSSCFRLKCTQVFSSCWRLVQSLLLVLKVKGYFMHYLIIGYPFVAIVVGARCSSFLLRKPLQFLFFYQSNKIKIRKRKVRGWHNNLRAATMCMESGLYSLIKTGSTLWKVAIEENLFTGTHSHKDHS